jgi:hypothetical protein
MVERTPYRLLGNPELDLTPGVGYSEVQDLEPPRVQLALEAPAGQSALGRVGLHGHDVVAACEVVGGVLAVMHADVKHQLSHRVPRCVACCFCTNNYFALSGRTFDQLSKPL